MIIQQGAVYWVRLEQPEDEEQPIAHPHVVIQPESVEADENTVITACALTTNAKKVSLHGNVLLEVGEANLPRQSVVEVSKVVVIQASQLGAYIGMLSEQRIQQILAGMRFVQRSFFSASTEE
ncbi:MAG: type II toxin-antitoxin system PemK/MazF family toxin [Chloroflexi bacterium CFX4]|nr:type II toxin-antitoxin system PemK/MazF family toxin [Chloroflexi bacterium CFX4]MDL1921069.1 type II toxin-antitoxin system PemK/MazF family toxin [Chloroflexi bacterium CFX3]